MSPPATCRPNSGKPEDGGQKPMSNKVGPSSHSIRAASGPVQTDRLVCTCKGFPHVHCCMSRCHICASSENRIGVPYHNMDDLLLKPSTSSRTSSMGSFYFVDASRPWITKHNVGLFLLANLLNFTLSQVQGVVINLGTTKATSLSLQTRWMEPTLITSKSKFVSINTANA